MPQTLLKRRVGSSGIPGSVAPGEPIVNTNDGTFWVGSNTSSAPFQVALGLQIQNSTFVYAASTGSANAYILTLTPTTTALVAGQSVAFKANFSNTGSATLNVNGLGAKTLTKNGTTALVSGDIVSGDIVTAWYDGTSYQIVGASCIQDISAGGTGATTSAGALANLLGSAPFSFPAGEIWPVTTTAISLTSSNALRYIRCTATCIITLPSAASNLGLVQTIKVCAAGISVTLATTGGDTIDGQASGAIVMSGQYDAITVIAGASGAWEQIVAY